MGISLNHSTGGTSISLTLKDKMVLLDGECGGTLPASVSFDTIEEKDENGEPIEKKIPIFQIIQELVNHFGEIPLTKILISDVDLEIRQVMKWTGEVPLYQYTYSKDGQNFFECSLNLREDLTPTKIFQYGEDVGYIYTDFVYPTELLGNAGDSVCDILDKIKNTLGNYEYFFDIYGNFVFQEKKNYLNTRQTTVQLWGLDSEEYLVKMKEGMLAYRFENSKLITSISNTPKYENIKNDFIVWGKKKTLEGNEYPIRYHLAIDDKPQMRKTLVPVELYEDEYGTKKARYNKDGITIPVKDWRTELYVRGLEADAGIGNAPYYFLELDNEWRKMYDLQAGDFTDDAKLRPYELDFFLDFIESDSKIGQYSISNIGRRTIVLTDDSINCLFEPEIPNVVFINVDDLDDEEIKNRYQNEEIVQVGSDIYDALTIGGTLNSAFVAVKDLLYQQTNFNESVSIQMVPIFHLEPNTRVSIVDKESGLDGDFVINSINIPLDVNSTMSISAVRALEKI